MSYFFGFLAVVFYLAAFGGCVMAKTSIHEIQGLISIIVGTLFLVGAGIIDAIHSAAKKPAPVAAEAQPAAATPTDYVCGKCRGLVPSDTRVCPHCHTKLVPQS